MLNFLRDWIKNIIYIVLFTSIIEMVLPNNSFRKYLRVTMGFFILLTVLNPLLSLITTDLDFANPFSSQSFKQEEQIVQKQGEVLIDKKQNLAVKVLERQLSQQIRTLILTQPGVNDARVDVTAQEDGKIKAVTIKLLSLQTEVKQGEDPSTKSVEESGNETFSIKPVEKISIGETNFTDTQENKGVGMTEEANAIKKSIRKFVASLYNLKPETIKFQ